MTDLKKLKIFRSYKVNEDIVRYTLRVDRKLFKKFSYVCKYNRRSANKQIEQYIADAVEEYEQRYGEILID